MIAPGSAREALHKDYSVILSAAKNPGILHVADSVQNDQLTYAEFSWPGRR